MPPRAGSRHTFCSGVRDDEGKLYLTDREPYLFHPHADNRVNTVVEGDTLFDLAGRYFAPLERACGYWWAIADYQPAPNEIVDPTLLLEPGLRLIVPSVRVLTDVILAETRRKEH